MARKPGVIQLYLSLLIILVVFIIPLITTLITDFWWFGALGFSSIFIITLKTKVALFFIGAATFLIFASINLWISSRIKKATQNFLMMKIMIAAGVSVLFGLSLTAEWMTVLQFFNQIDFNIIDPIFYKDVSFYVFSLPFFMLIWKFALACVIVTLLFVAVDYVKSELIRSLKKPEIKPQVVNGEVPNFKFKPEFKLKKPELVHMAILGSLIFIIFKKM